MFLLAFPAGAESETYGGWLHVDEDSESPRFQVIRNQEEFQDFLALIPKKRPHKRQPAPPNNDPLLKKNIDFEKQVLVVAIRTQTLSFRPEYLGTTENDKSITLSFSVPELKPEARPFGWGVYLAVPVSKTEKELKVVFQPE